MCRPASFVLTKEQVFWSKNTDSHEDIIEEFGLHPDGAKGPNILRIEISPEDGDLSTDCDKWQYRVDQDILPEWADATVDEERSRKALSEWVGARLFVNQIGVNIVGGGHAYLYNSSAVLRDNSSADLWDNSSAVLRGNSSAVLRDNSSADLRDNSSAVLRDNSSADLWGNSIARAFGTNDTQIKSRCAVVLKYSKGAVEVFTKETPCDTQS